MSDKTLHRGFAALSLFISFVVYLITMAPTVSFWDCGEFIACAYKLAIPHPPGAPVYLLLGRFFSMLPLFEDIGARVNFISVLGSAFTVLFLHLIIVHFVRDYLKSTEGFNRYLPHLGGFIGAITFAFTHSFWFNAVEAEVYSLSMFFTSLFVWLTLHWCDRAEVKGSERYLLLIFYLMGLAMGVHILNALVLPMLVMLVYNRKYQLEPISFLVMGGVGVALTGLFYPGLVKGIPEIISLSFVGFGGFAVLLILLMFAIYLAIKAEQNLLSLFLTAVLLIVVGYSSFMMVFIRSNLDPNIDENDPETISSFISYINREQYGDHHLNRELRRQESPNGNRYSGAWDFFINYQINEMYIRYFLWNYGGIEDTQDFNRERKRADLTQFWLLPLVIGFLGAFYHGYRDRKNFLAVFVLFFMTGLAIVLYLNQPDPQPRERDYSYVGSFFAFAIWIGIGAAAIMENVHLFFKERNSSLANHIPWVAFALLLVMPARMFAVNFHSHNRTGNYVASDYSYNMLINAEENGIIFTNGDNDTFPLWYLQEVENLRTDVRVANLSLLNTSWYIKQLKNTEPKVPISLSDEQIEQINIYPWPEARNFEVPTIPEAIRRAEAQQYKISTGADTVAVPDKLIFEVRPKIQVPTRGGGRMGALRIQDYMILNILTTNRFQKPLYFAVTSSDQNRLDGLRRYQRMDGLLFKVTTIPNWQIDPDLLYDNLMNKFRYRNLNNPHVYYNENIIGLLQNYRSGFFRLANHYLENKNMERFREVIQRLYEIMPPEVIPYTNTQFAEILNAMAFMAEVYPMDSLHAEKYGLRQLQVVGEISLNYQLWDYARPAFERLLAAVESPEDSAVVAEYIRSSLFRQPNYYDQATPEQKKTALDNMTQQIKRNLLRTYREQKDYDTALQQLEKWLAAAPENKYFQEQLAQFRKLKEQTTSGS